MVVILKKPSLPMTVCLIIIKELIANILIINLNQKQFTSFLRDDQIIRNSKPHPSENFSSFFIRYRDLKPNSRARYYSYFSGFFKWYSGENLPFKVKTARVEPQLVSDAEVELLRRALCAKLTHRGILERDLLILDTMAMTGLRRGGL